MEMSREIDVTSLDAAHRRALEDVLGAPLQASQRLVISVAESAAPAAPRVPQSLDDWKKVYQGLSEEQVDSIDRDLKTRANSARASPSPWAERKWGQAPRCAQSQFSFPLTGAASRLARSSGVPMRSSAYSLSM